MYKCGICGVEYENREDVQFLLRKEYALYEVNGDRYDYIVCNECYDFTDDGIIDEE